MEQRLYVCLSCTYKFQVNVIDRQEAEEQNIPVRSIRCPQCKSKEIIEADKVK